MLNGGVSKSKQNLPTYHSNQPNPQRWLLDHSLQVYEAKYDHLALTVHYLNHRFKIFIYLFIIQIFNIILNKC